MNAPTEQTIRRLFASSNNKCAFPQCTTPIFDPSGTRLGEICHIKAKSKGGPRFDKTQLDEERHAFANLILLCGNHHTAIDAEPGKFTHELLYEIKAIHEKSGRKEITEDDTRYAQALLDPYLKIESKNHSAVMVNSPNGTIINAGTGNSIHTGTGDIINVHTKKIHHTNKFTPGPEHISGETAQRLKEIANEIVERLTVKGGDVGRAYKGVWSDFNAHFGITYYRELPREKAEDGIKYLQQWRASKNSKLRRADPEKFRTAQLRGIWPRAKNLGFNDEELYRFAEQKLELKKSIDTLNDLGINQLERLNRFLNYEIRKRSR